MKKLIIAVSVLAAVAFVRADALYVAASSNGTGVFEREVRKMYDEPLFTVGTTDRLQVLEQGKRSIKVQLPSGEAGWVEKRLVKTVSSRGFVFDKAEVTGYFTNLSPIYIGGDDDSPDEMIRLERSFKDALNDNIDRETVCRQAQ